MTTARIASPPVLSRTRRRRLWFNWRGASLIVALALLVELLVQTRIVDFQYVPAPSAVIGAGWRLLASGRLLSDTGHTLSAALLGWAIGSAAGIVLGTWLGLSKWARRFGLTSVEVLRAVPGIAFVPVVILIFGFTITMEVVTILFVCVWPVLVNAVAGAQAVTEVHDDMARTLQLSRLQRVFAITLPTAVPYIATGMKLGLSTSLALAVVAEMVGNPAGLGYAIVYFQGALQPASMFAVIVWIGLLGLALNLVYELVTGRLSTVRAGLAEAR